MDKEVVAKQIVDSCIKIHRILGPGLLESAYQRCLTYELQQRGMQVEHELLLPVKYEGITLETGYRIDMLVEKCVVIENKCVDAILPIHIAQLFTYLKLTNLRLGFLLNWKVKLMKDGINRYMR